MSRKPYFNFSNKFTDSLIGGPHGKTVPCMKCGKDWFDYRTGSADWKARNCHKCEAKKFVDSMDKDKLKELAQVIKKHGGLK